MIGYVKGIVILRKDPQIVIDVNGVGYRVFASQPILAKAKVGEVISVFTHTHVREDALELYGFIDEASLELFELLISVSGIGPKTAIGVFSLGDKDAIVGAIRKADVEFFTGVARLGTKNAQKIIIELKNKIGAIEELNLQADGQTSEVMQALTSFGFSQEEARYAIREVGDKGKNVSETVRLALKYLGK